MVGYRILLAVVAMAGFVVAGCGGPEGTSSDDSTAGDNGGDAHDHDHAAPETLAEAAEVLAEMRGELAEAYESADVKTVDGVWHEMYPVAKKAKELVASSELDRYDQEDAEGAADELIQVLEKLHPPHGADAKVDPEAFTENSEALNDSIDKLQAAADKLAAAE